MAKQPRRQLSPEEAAQKRRQNVVLGGGLAALIAVAAIAAAFTGAGPTSSRTAAPETKPIAIGGSASDKDAWRAQEATRIEVLIKETKELRQRQVSIEEENKRLKAEMLAKQSLTGQGYGVRGGDPSGPDGAPRAPSYPPPPAVPPSSPPRQIGTAPNAMPPPMPMTAGRPGAPLPPTGPALRVLAVAAAPDATRTQERAYNDETQSSPASDAGVQNYIPAGSFARAVLLNGVDAPTGGNAQQNPMPILLQLLDDAQLPNNFRSRLSGCFAIADAHGDLSSERVLARLNRLSCVDEDGGAVDLQVAGFITDETGRVGAQGTLITKTGQVLANAMFSGVLSGIGKGIQAEATQQNTTIAGAVTTQVNNPWKAGLGEGLGKSFDRISDYYLKLADKLFPVVSIDPGRTVEIVFTKGVKIQRK